MLIPLDIPLTFREKNLINVLRQTSGFPYMEIESIYRQCGSIDSCIKLIDHAVGSGMSLQDVLMKVPIVLGPDDKVPNA